MRKYLSKKWEYLTGTIGEFTFENRMVNSICVITFLFVFLLMIFNVALSFFEEAFICMAILVATFFVYNQARYRKKYKTGVIVYAIVSYVALCFAFYYNSGIEGPVIIFFFLTFQVLVSATPKILHTVWAILHVVLVTALCIIEYKYPDFITNTYPSRLTQYADIVFSYVTCLIFVYVVTIHFRNNLDRIRKKSMQRAEEIETNLHEIEQQNEKLKEISWLQSHKVRSQVATILGLSQFVNHENIEDPDLNRVVSGIKEAAKELDDVIKEINRLTNSADINK